MSSSRSPQLAVNKPLGWMDGHFTSKNPSIQHYLEMSPSIHRLLKIELRSYSADLAFERPPSARGAEPAWPQACICLLVATQPLRSISVEKLRTIRKESRAAMGRSVSQLLPARVEMIRRRPCQFVAAGSRIVMRPAGPGRGSDRMYTHMHRRMRWTRTWTSDVPPIPPIPFEL